MPDLHIQKTRIIEIAGGAQVEMTLSDAISEPQEPVESIRLRVTVAYKGHPRLIEVHELAFRRVRDVVGGEIQRIAGIRGRTGG
jgi:hypothetical protein